MKKYIYSTRTWWSHLNKWFKLCIVAVLILTIGLLGYSQLTAKDSTQSYQYTQVKKGDITEVVSETGEVVTSGTVAVSSSITGVVTAVRVENGQQVVPGAVLFTVASTATAAEKAAAQAAYLQAKNAVDSAQTTQLTLQAKMFDSWDRYKQLAESDSYENTTSDARNLPEFKISQNEWLAAEATYKAQEAVISQSKVALQKAWLEYQAATSGSVTATATGTVENISVATGQTVGAETTALVITSDQDQWVQVAVNESEITQVIPGQKALVSVDALQGQTITAVVERVDTVGTVVSDVVVYNVYLRLDATELRIRPAMTVQVDITTTEKKDALLVPSAAIKQYQGGKAVQIYDTERRAVLYKPVETGLKDETHTEIVQGLEVGEEIIISGATSTTSPNSGGSGRAAGPIFGGG